MTATATPPRAPAAGGPAAGRPARATPPAPPSDPTSTATLALGALTLSVALGFGRLLSGWEWFWPGVVTTVAAHAVAWWCRRNRLPTGAAAIATIGAALVAGAWTILGHTTAYGVPTPHTLEVALEALADARSSFQSVKPPAEPLPGFVIGIVVAVGITAFLADWAAFRVQSAFEACVPAFSLFLFQSVFARGRSSTFATVAFLLAALGFLLAQAFVRQSRAGIWFGGRPGGGPAALVTLAAVLAAVAAVAGAVLGPALPGYGEQGLVKPQGKRGPTTRATLSPLVDIRGRLSNTSNIEVFTVEASEPAYWRVTSLDTFDGKIWKSNATYRDVSGTVRTNEPLIPGVPTREVVQTFSLRGLDTIWLPAAWRPARIDGLREVSFNSDSASFITPSEFSNYLNYTITSRVPALTADQLRGAPAAAPRAIAERYMVVPSSITARVRAEAARIVAGATTPYDQAIALQQHFRDNFRYELDVRQGHDVGALENFLFSNRRGYCEQFAGAFAVLARIVGLPARVAVGFTPGELEDDGLFHVRDINAHAWPEVYLHGFGWVAFEPTPSRGNPQAEQYTNVPSQQATPEGGDSATTVPTETTVSPGDETPSTQPPSVDLGEDPGASGAGGDDGGLPLPFWVALGALVAAGLAAAAVATVQLVRLRRWGQGVPSRRLDGGPPGAPPTDAERVWAAWEDASDALRRANVPRRQAETLVEFAERASASGGLPSDVARELRSVARDASAVAYSDASLGPDGAARALAAARAVRAAVRSQLSSWEWLRTLVDPRLLRPRT